MTNYAKNEFKIKSKIECNVAATIMTSRLPSGAIPHNINIILLSLSKSINQTFHTLRAAIATIM